MKITQPKGIASLALSASASGVTISDPGGYFGGGPFTLEEWVALVGSGIFGPFLTKTGGEGGHTIEDLGTLGPTALVDLANANIFLGELAEPCTISTTGWAAGGRYIRVSLTGDGTSIATFTGVTWVGGAPGVIGSGDTLHMTLFSDDSGTIIWGFIAGGAGAGDAQTPYYIPVGSTFTVPIYKQALFTMPITVDGTLDVIGYLIEVD